MWKNSGIPIALLSLALFVNGFGFFLSPPKAHAQIPFGGLITKVVHCGIPAGALWMTITPAGGSPMFQIWTPATKTFREGPPTHPGQWVLGLDAAPGLCVVTVRPYYALPGFFMLMVGTSK